MTPTKEGGHKRVKETYLVDFSSEAYGTAYLLFGSSEHQFLRMLGTNGELVFSFSKMTLPTVALRLKNVFWQTWPDGSEIDS